jgi:hypothetical protein
VSYIVYISFTLFFGRYRRSSRIRGRILLRGVECNKKKLV